MHTLARARARSHEQELDRGRSRTSCRSERLAHARFIEAHRGELSDRRRSPSGGAEARDRVADKGVLEKHRRGAPFAAVFHEAPVKDVKWGGVKL